MAERRVSVRLAAIDGDRFKADLHTIGQEGQQALGAIAGGAAPASGGLVKVDSATAALLRQLETLSAQATRASASLRHAGVTADTVTERIDKLTGVTGRFRRNAADFEAYGRALDDLRAKYNPLYAEIQRYLQAKQEIRRANAVGAISEDEMTAAIRRERKASLESIAAIKARTNALHGMQVATRINSAQTANLRFQLFDIAQGIPLAFQSPLYALQNFAFQGAQIAQTFGPEEGGVARAIGESGKMVGRLGASLGRVALRFWPLALAAAAVGASVAGIQHEINQVSDVTVGFGDTALATWQVVSEGITHFLKPAIDAIAPLFASAWQWVVDLTGQAWDAIVQYVHGKGNEIVNTIDAAVAEMGFIWGNFPTIVGAAITSAANLVIDGTESAVNKAIQLLNSLAEQANAILSHIPGVSEDTRIGIIDPVDLGRLDDTAVQDYAALKKKHDEEIAAIFASDPLGEFFSAVKEKAIINALKRTEEAADKTGDAMGNAASKSSDAWEKAKTPLQQYAETAGSVGDLIQNSFTRAFSSVEDAISQFVQKGKVDFSSLVSSLLADLAKLSIRQSILGPLANALDGVLSGGGNIFASVLHEGGRPSEGLALAMPANAFTQAPRYHTGRPPLLQANEQAAVIRHDERVLNPRETREWEAGARGQAPVQISINARDADSFRRSRTQIASDIARAVAFGQRGL